MQRSENKKTPVIKRLPELMNAESDPYGTRKRQENSAIVTNAMESDAKSDVGQRFLLNLMEAWDNLDDAIKLGIMELSGIESSMTNRDR